MNEMMNYIFRKLKTSEMVMQNVLREMRQQKRSSRNAAIMAGVAVYFAVAAGAEQRKQAERIRNLEKEIEELKRPEGE